MRKVRTAFNSNGSKILQLDKYVRCFSFPELGNLWCFSGENGFVENTEETDWEASCAWSNPVFSPHSPNAFCGSETGKIYCWDINEGKVLGEIQAHTHQVENLAISPDGQHLASIGPDGTLKLWRLDA
jgi:WD40 repeat protein